MPDTEKNVRNFQDNAERLLAMRFNSRFPMADTVEKALLLDIVTKGLSSANFFSDVVLKGGGALQRAYGSQRFSSDLDFACGRIPVFTPEEFNEYGKDFTACFLRILKESFGISERNVSINTPAQIKDRGLFGERRNVATWFLSVRIPDEMSLINTNMRMRRLRNAGMVNMKSDIQNIKIEICNVPAYMKNIKSIYPSSPDDYTAIESNVESPEEILYDKIATLMTRRKFKYSDIFDAVYAEFLAENTLQKCDVKFIKTKITDQMISKENIGENIRKNLSLIAPTATNIFTFRNEIGSVLTSAGYHAVYNDAEAMLSFCYDKCLHFLPSISKGLAEKFDRRDLPDIKNAVRGLLTLYGEKNTPEDISPTSENTLGI